MYYMSFGSNLCMLGSNKLRSTDPGAISAIGWSSDLSRGNEPMLQYHLLAVYCEYSACEETYDDLLAVILERVQSLCSDDAVRNPWVKHGIKFVLCGIQGDLKWITTKYDLHHFNRNSCCSRCDATKKDPDPCKTIGCFTDAAAFTACTHESFCEAHALEQWPLPMLHGVRLERFMHDVAHSQYLGSGKTLNGSCLVLLCELGEFHPNGHFPTQGNYESNLQQALRAAYINFKTWAKTNRIAVNQPRFTCSRLNRKSRGNHACLASKAVSGKILSFWLASCATSRSERLHATSLDKLVATCVWSYAAMIRAMDAAGLVLKPEEAEAIFNHGMVHLRTYAHLRSLSAQIRRGKIPNRNLWTLLPKHHHLWHALHDAKNWKVNPMGYNLLAAESWVGSVGRMSRFLGMLGYVGIHVCSYAYSHKYMYIHITCKA